MKIIFWHIRGFGARGHRNQLRDLLFCEHIDILCLQETKRDNFSLTDFNGLGGSDFTWNWVPAIGSAGGILIGSRNDLLDVSNVLVSEFFLSLRLTCRVSSVSWDLVSVYGPSDHTLSARFLEALDVHLSNQTFPVLLGGDFNLLRFPSEKSSDHFCADRK